MHRYRPAIAADVDAIIALQRAYYEEDGYPFAAARMGQLVRRLLSEPSLGMLWVAEVDGQVAGYVALTLGFSLEHGGRDAFIDELLIAPAHRRQGLGRAGMDLAAIWAREQGVQALHLEVEPHREAAIALYEELGFQGTGRVLMSRRLNADPDPS